MTSATSPQPICAAISSGLSATLNPEENPRRYSQPHLRVRYRRHPVPQYHARPAGLLLLQLSVGNKFGTGITALIVLAIIAAAAYGIYAFLGRTRPVPFQNIAVTKVTETGKASLAAISPDGKYILSVMSDNGQESLWLRNIPSNSNTQVLAPAQARYTGLQFSPDGNYLYFVRNEAGNQELEYLYRAPVLGGTLEKLVTDIDSNITFSPDGKQFAYVRYNNPDPDKFRLIIRSAASGEEKVLIGGAASEGLYDPAWSPDGKTIVCFVLQPGTALSGLVAINVAGDGQRKLFATQILAFSQGQSGSLMAADLPFCI